VWCRSDKTIPKVGIASGGALPSPSAAPMVNARGNEGDPLIILSDQHYFAVLSGLSSLFTDFDSRALAPGPRYPGMPGDGDRRS